MLVMEYMHRGSLGDVLANPSMVIEAEQAMDLIRDIASGMLYLHMSGITHGDLKSHNILVDSHMRGKVSDFGFSTKTKATRFAGTPCWMAPEVLRGEQPTQASGDRLATLPAPCLVTPSQRLAVPAIACLLCGLDPVRLFSFS